MNQDPTPLEPLPLDDPLATALRRALAGEADAVTASPDGLVRIRQSIDAGAGAGTSRRRTAIAALAAAAVVAVAGGSALLARTGRDRPPVSAPPAGSQSPRPSGASSGPAAGSAGLPVYYVGTVGASFGLFREFHARIGGEPPSSDPARRVQQAVTEAMSGRPLDPDYRTVWAEGADARTTLAADRITIELNEAAAGGTAVGGSDADVYALQQLIWTATAAAASTDPNAPTEVVIRALGPTPERFGSISLAQPFRRGTRLGAGDPRAPVWIESLGQGATVGPGPLTVTGQGVGGTRPLRWTLTQDGVPVASSEVTPTTGTGAPAGVGVRGSWTITVTPPGAGRYTLAVAEDLPSDATGGVDDKDFAVG